MPACPCCRRWAQAAGLLTPGVGQGGRGQRWRKWGRDNRLSLWLIPLWSHADFPALVFLYSTYGFAQWPSLSPSVLPWGRVPSVKWMVNVYFKHWAQAGHIGHSTLLLPLYAGPSFQSLSYLRALIHIGCFHRWALTPLPGMPYSFMKPSLTSWVCIPSCQRSCGSLAMSVVALVLFLLMSRLCGLTH